MMAVVPPESFWVQVFRSKVAKDLLEENHGALCSTIDKSSTNNASLNLLKLAIQEGASIDAIEYLVQEILPVEALLERDASGKTALHHACVATATTTSTNAVSSFELVQMLVQRAPSSVLVRCFLEDEDDQNDTNGVLPSMLAHCSSGASTRTVRYLLDIQLKLQQALILTHSDLAYLGWHQATYLERLIAVAWENTHCLREVSLLECRLSYCSWKLLQDIVAAVPGGRLQKLCIRHLHIWQAQVVGRQEQRQRFQMDVRIWQEIIEKHQSSLQILELPGFYALTSSTIYAITNYLTMRRLPHLKTLNFQSINYACQFSDEAMTNLAEVVNSRHCHLQSLSLGNLTAHAFHLLLKSLRFNTSIQSLAIGNVNILGVDNLKDMRRCVLKMLDDNSTLGYFRGPHALARCPRVDFYLTLNREYRRKDMGHWSASLVSEILAKAATATSRPTRSKDADETSDSSVVFYILQSRPDILNHHTVMQQ